MNTKVDYYFNKTQTWQEEIRELRKITLACHLTETLKWGCPCYTFEGNNIVLIHVFREYCALLFFKGVLLKDPEGILVQQTAQVQVARQIRFTDTRQITRLAATLKSYIFEAVRVEEAGWKAPLKKTAEFSVPEEFRKRLEENPGLNAAFQALTPGRQRAYLLHFAGAKQSRTRESRIEKVIPRILEGKGWNEE